MRYVNEDIVLRGDEAKQFVYNLHHPNVAKIVEENRRRDSSQMMVLRLNWNLWIGPIV